MNIKSRKFILILTLVILVIIVVLLIASSIFLKQTTKSRDFGGYSVTKIEGDSVGSRKVSMAIGVDDLPILSYSDTKAGTVKIIKCGNFQCSSNNFIQTIDKGGQSGLAIDKKGSPVIAYIDDAGLRVAFCRDERCSSIDKRVIVHEKSPTTERGYHQDYPTEPSLVVTEDGIPLIAFYSLNTEDKRGNDKFIFLKCGNPQCSEGNIKTVIAEGLFVWSSENAISLTPEGLPVLAYDGPDGNNLIFIRCDDPACSSRDETKHGIPSAHAETVSLVAHKGGLFAANESYRYVDPSSSYATTRVVELQVMDMQEILGHDFVTTVLKENLYSVYSVDVMINSNGLPIVAYARGPSLAMVFCQNLPCTQRKEIELPITEEGGIRSISMVMGNDNLPIVAVSVGYIKYRDPLSPISWDRLYVVKCTLPFCITNQSVVEE